MNPVTKLLDERSRVSLADIAAILLRSEIGFGSDRHVFVCGLDEKLVAKISNTENQNVIEWETWQTFKGTKAARYLAPCIAISPRGDCLLQRRTTPIPPGREPKQLPAFLCDFKPENFGILDGRIVAHDYGTVDRILGNSTKLKRVHWRR